VVARSRRCTAGEARDAAEPDNREATGDAISRLWNNYSDNLECLPRGFGAPASLAAVVPVGWLRRATISLVRAGLRRCRGTHRHGELSVDVPLECGLIEVSSTPVSSPSTAVQRPGGSTGVRVVGIGASAGGLAALEQFLAAIPASTGLAFAVVQHLDPTHKAMLGELLQRSTTMPVREATASMRVSPDSVYVIPPNADLTIARGALHLAPPAQPRGMRLPVDLFFSSLAREQGEQAIGVVLSGMGSDGTLGLQAIKSQGGLALVQQPESAQFDSMPLSAIAVGAFDIIGSPMALAQHIQRLLCGKSTPKSHDIDLDQATQRSFDGILTLMRDRSKHDLALYKPSTLRRRIDRRLGIHSLKSFAEYEEFLKENPAELDLLFKEMLIGITAFFRDEEHWVAVRQTLLPMLLQSRAPETHSRAWVAGCSTGEEAYSLAMVFAEIVDALPAAAGCTLQIFATDLSSDAISTARRGYYSAQVAASVGPERLSRFFTPEGNGFVVVKKIREMILFAQHDMILDPPFTRLDMLSCRNVMIYFNGVLQSRLLKLFHYALRPGGLLALGESESIGRAQDLFGIVVPKLRVFRRNASPPVAGSVDFPSHRPSGPRANPPEPIVPTSFTGRQNLQSMANQVVLEQFAPPAVLVNERGDVIYINGRTGRYLEPASGKANWNIHVMARPAIRTQLASALRQAVSEKVLVVLNGLKLSDAEPGAIDVIVKPLREANALEGTVLIVFKDVASSARGDATGPVAAGTSDAAASDELLHAREELRVLRQEMRASEEELQAANEELQSTNEELQSANEELTTSKEEAQSMNEELQTINAELQSKLDDLALAQSDMQNLLNSTDIATLFLDSELNVRRFTDRITRIIHLREGDVGRPLTDLASTLIYPELHADAKETLRTLVFCEKQIPTTDGNWYSVRIMPYRTLANVIQGVVITFVDISAAKQLEGRLRTE
jgi:two-component system CheB/CheR fusion protein